MIGLKKRNIKKMLKLGAKAGGVSFADVQADIEATIVIVAICSFVCYQIRINVEEAVLQKYFKEYKLYKEKTYKLFPYIY